MHLTSYASAAFGVLALATVGCAGAPAAPFDQLKTANATAYRLQNFEPPAAVAAVPGAAAVPGVPPEIMNWIQQGAQGLTQLIPPGLLPPGLIPGTGTAATPGAPTATDAPRFHNFRILAQTQVIDPDLREKLGEILGDADSYDNQYARCAPGTIYPEMGLSFSGGTVANDILISFSCSQVVSRSFAWPHPATGMKPDTVGALTEVVQKLWPQGT